MNKEDIPPIIEIKDEDENKSNAVNSPIPEIKEEKKVEIKEEVKQPTKNNSSIGYIIVSLLVPFVGAIFFMEWHGTEKKEIGSKTLVCSLINGVLLVLVYAIILPAILGDDRKCFDYGVDYEYREDETGSYCTVDDITRIYLEKKDDNTNADQQNKYIDNDIKIEYDDVFYVVIKDEIDNFRDLDYSNKLEYKSAKAQIKINNGKITYSNGKDVEVPKVTNAISVGLREDCKKVNSIIYLTDKNELYEIELTNGNLALNNDNELDSSKVILLAKDATNFALLKSFDVGNCNNSELVYKNTVGDTRFLNRIVDGKAKYVSLDEKEVKWLSIYTNNYVIYGINEFSKAGNPIKDKDDKDMTCSALFLNEEDGNTYIITEQGYLYSFGESEFKNKKGKLVSEKKVTKFKGSDDKIVITFEDKSEMSLSLIREY